MNPTIIALSILSLNAFAQKTVTLETGQRVKRISGVKVKCIKGKTFRSPRRKTVYITKGQEINVAGTQVKCSAPREAGVGLDYWLMKKEFEASYDGKDVSQEISKLCAFKSSCTFSPAILFPPSTSRNRSVRFAASYFCVEPSIEAARVVEHIEVFRPFFVDSHGNEKVTLHCGIGKR